MLHHYQAKSLDNIYLEDIPHIIHPDYAARDLADTTLPNRNIQEWNLPQGYSHFVSRYHQFHWQRPWMSYRDTRDDIKCGKVVLTFQNPFRHLSGRRAQTGLDTQFERGETCSGYLRWSAATTPSSVLMTETTVW